MLSQTIWLCLKLVGKAIGTTSKCLWKGQPHSGAAHMSSPPRLANNDDERW